jgi:hypothetical protein
MHYLLIRGSRESMLVSKQLLRRETAEVRRIGGFLFFVMRRVKFTTRAQYNVTVRSNV